MCDARVRSITRLLDTPDLARLVQAARKLVEMDFGFVTAALTRHVLVLDPVSAAWLRERGARAKPGKARSGGSRPTRAEAVPGESPARDVASFVATLHEAGVLPKRRASLLPDGTGDGRSRLSRLRTQLLFARDHDPAAHSERLDEIASLANVLVAGCPFQSRRFRAIEAAGDEAPGHAPTDGSVNPYLGERKAYTIARGQYSLDRTSYVGAPLTDTELADGHNRVAATDLSLKLGEVVFQPSARFNQSVSWSRVRFDRASDGTNVYTVDVLNTRTTFQVDRHFFLRAIVQYDSSRHEVLTDLLASWELLPGTVAYAGYGSILERRGWDGSGFTDDPTGVYRTSERGFFLKASYIHRF